MDEINQPKVPRCLLFDGRTIELGHLVERQVYEFILRLQPVIGGVTMFAISFPIDLVGSGSDFILGWDTKFRRHRLLFGKNCKNLALFALLQRTPQ